MTRPRYLLWAKDFGRLQTILENRLDDNDIKEVRPEMLGRITDYLTDDAMQRFKNAAPKIAAMSADTREKFSQTTLRILAIENPYHWFEYRKKELHPAREVVEPSISSYVVPFKSDPGEIGLPATAAIDARIAFADGGAPTQVHRAVGQHGVSFLRRYEALRQIEVNRGRGRNREVHVFVVDQGMHPDYVNHVGGAGAYEGILWDSTLTPEPAISQLPSKQDHRHKSWPQWHAHMIVRNIFGVVGKNPEVGNKVKIWDVPIIPDRVGEVGTVFDALAQQYEKIHSKIEDLNGEKCIVVNAWGVKNRLREAKQGDFTADDPAALTQDLNDWIDKITKIPNQNNARTAVVFAAGNTGLFTPDSEAGPYDKGPKRSIWMPAALELVFAVGATDPTGMWIGASSQGPAFTGEKPDFVLPSYFREDNDAHVLNTGSSASCAVMAGLIAGAWLNRPNPINHARARQHARKVGHRDHNSRLGHGVPRETFLQLPPP